MANPYKVFTAYFSKNRACNCHPEYETHSLVLVTTSTSTALGLILEEYEHTSADEWSIEEVDMDTETITEL